MAQAMISLMTRLSPSICERKQRGSHRIVSQSGLDPLHLGCQLSVPQSLPNPTHGSPGHEVADCPCHVCKLTQKFQEVLRDSHHPERSTTAYSPGSHMIQFHPANSILNGIAMADPGGFPEMDLIGLRIKLEALPDLDRNRQLGTMKLSPSFHQYTHRPQ